MKKFFDNFQLKSLFAVAVFTTLTGFSSLGHEVAPREVKYRGNGCPQGTTSVVLTEDKQTFSILYGPIQAEAGGVVEEQTDRKFCEVTIPLSIPEGYQIALEKLDLRGFVGLPASAHAKLRTKVYYVSPRKKGKEKYQRRFLVLSEDEHFEGEQEDSRGTFEDFEFSYGPDQIEPGRCDHGDLDVVIKSTLTVESNNEREQSMLVLDSIDGLQKIDESANLLGASHSGDRAMASAARFHFRPCKSNKSL